MAEQVVDEIINLIDGIVEARFKKKQKPTVLKALARQGVIDLPAWDRPDYPDYWPGYALCVDWLEQIRIHAQKGVFPERLFAVASPNATDLERNYMWQNYQQDTLNVFKDYVDTNARAFHDANWNIEFSQDQDQYKVDGLQQYLEKELPVFGSIYTFAFEFLPPLKFMDAMGIVAVMPYNIPLVEDSDGIKTIDPRGLVSPYPNFYHCSKVMANEDEYVIIESEEFSEVLIGDRKVNEGMVFYYFDKTTIYRVFQTGAKKDYVFERAVYFEHNLQVIPCVTVGGITIEIDEKIIEQSPFLYVVDTLNRIIIDSATLMLVKANCGFPYRVMVGDRCEYDNVVEGEHHTCDGGYFVYNQSRRVCGGCAGTGMKERISPSGTLYTRPPSSLSQGDSVKPSEAIAFVGPDVGLLKNMREEIDAAFDQAYQFLHLKRSDATSNPNATATEALAQAKALIASVKMNSDQLFRVLAKVIDFIGGMRYGAKYQAPNIQPPTNFDYITELEAMQMISQAITAGLPPIVIQENVYKYLQTMYYNDARGKKIFDLLSIADRILTVANEDIDMMLSKGRIEKWEAVLHDSARAFINQLVTANPKFFEQAIEVQVQQLQEIAKTRALEITPVQVVNRNGQTPQARLEAILQS